MPGKSPDLPMEVRKLKLIMAILNTDDSVVVSKELSRVGYSSTTTNCAGGFLMDRKDMLMIGVDDMRVRDVLRIIEEFSHSREQQVEEPERDEHYRKPARVKVGGATVFVLDVDQFHKL